MPESLSKGESEWCVQSVQFDVVLPASRIGGSIGVWVDVCTDVDWRRNESLDQANQCRRAPADEEPRILARNVETHPDPDLETFQFYTAEASLQDQPDFEAYPRFRCLQRVEVGL